MDFALLELQLLQL